MFAGIDTHKDTLAVAVIDHAGRQLAQRDIPNTVRGFDVLVALLESYHVVRVGIEGSGNYGRAVAVHLVLGWAGERQVNVVEVPTLMTSRERRSQLGKGKTDPVDSLAIARITAREDRLPPVRLAVGPAADLRALIDYREDLIAERSATANRVHADLTGLLPGYQTQITTLATPVKVRAALVMLEGLTGVRADLTRRRLERITDIDREVTELKNTIAALVEDSGTSLTAIHGIGPVVAAQLLAEVVDINRYANRNAFAAANGTAPLPASSGRTVRHRYNPGGNRRLNRALYTIAITQIRSETEGRAYYQRKRAEGKTGREALRCLKRRLSDVVFTTMRNDAAAAATTTTAEPLPIEQMAVGAAAAHEARLTA